jgi:ParB family chromosome partitioning protein
MTVQTPVEFAEKIVETLAIKAEEVGDLFNIDEDKEGYFVATLYPQKFLDKTQFRMMCALVKDLGGEGYLQGAKSWMVPGPLAKKSPMTSSESPKQPSSIAPNLVTDDKNKPEIRNIRFISVNAIHVPSFLPTRELIDLKQGKIRESIKKHGLKYPIRVRPGSEPDTYELIDGFLRLQSVKQMGWKEIPAEIKETSDREVVIESIITNKDRIEEDPITIAKKLDILVNAFGYTQEKLAEELGVSRPWVTDSIRFLKLPKEVQHCLALDNVSRYHGLLLLTLEKPELQIQLAKEVVDGALSTRQLEERIQEVQPKPGVPPPIKNLKPQDVTYGKAKEILDTPAGREVLADAVKEALAKGKISSEDDDEPWFCEGIATVEGEHEPLAGSEKAGAGSSEPRRNKLEGTHVGEFVCPECKERFFIDHISADKHRLTKDRRPPE